jgi:hypothetical protein
LRLGRRKALVNFRSSSTSSIMVRGGFRQLLARTSGLIG